ncbi:MAG: hypothetical protein WKF61_01230 [Luteimonas sp.]
MLKTPEQLPDLEGDDIVLLWDAEDYQRGGDTLIRYGSEVIWREPAQYEGYERFIEVANLLKQKYGDRLQDLVPSRNSELYLYGDALGSPSRISKFREELGLYPNQKAMRDQFKR